MTHRININKFIKLACFLLFLCLNPNLKGQTSELITFQVTVQDYQKNILANQNLNAKIGIVSEKSDIFYQEEQMVTTNSRGLASIQIGKGINKIGNLNSIDWENGANFYYIKTAFDQNGGTNFSLVINTLIESVPYALQAKYVENFDETDPEFKNSVSSKISKENIENWNRSLRDRHYQGDVVAGGIVFMVDSTGENGLVASLQDINSSVVWSPSAINIEDNSSSNGEKNTEAIVQELGPGDYAAFQCDNLIINRKNDWYLPSLNELSLLFDSRYEINKALEIDEDVSTEGISNKQYWSSTQINQDSALSIQNGNITALNNDSLNFVRAIRQFSGLYDINNYAWIPLLGPEEELKSDGNVSIIVENEDGDVVVDEDGKRGTVCRPIPEIKLPVKITFNLQTKYDPEASEEPTILRGTGDFRICFGGPPKGVQLDEIQEANMGEFEGVQFRIHPHLDESPIRVYTGTEPHTCTSIWLRYVDPSKLVDDYGLPITGLASDECQGRGSQCGWERVGLFENGFGLDNMEETLVTIIISDTEISISVKDRTWGVNIDDLLKEDNDIVGDVLRFDNISYMSISHTNTSRGYDWIKITDLRVIPLK
ncbi:MAG: DUF1566 domain-containing protein [Bacteroidales bacterium]|nr:DUF1566 domain-containing protein [Bacteroidales bacterium]